MTNRTLEHYNKTVLLPANLRNKKLRQQGLINKLSFLYFLFVNNLMFLYTRTFLDIINMTKRYPGQLVLYKMLKIPTLQVNSKSDRKLVLRVFVHLKLYVIISVIVFKCLIT